MLRPLLLILAATSLLTVSAADGDEPQRDRVIARSGPDVEAEEVISETLESVTYKVSGSPQPVTRRSGTVLRVTYAGMRSGPYRAGLDALERGDTATAVERFTSIAGGEREWEKFYGAFAAGDAQERAGKFSDAAKTFDELGKAFPKHRLIMDVMYREGMNQAWAKDAAGAGKTADALGEMAKGVLGQPADARANAIRAAAAWGTPKADELARKASFRPSDEPDAWFHFNNWLAQAYRDAKRPKDVARVVDAMMPNLDSDPDQRMRAVALKGLALVDSDPQSAVVELIKLDVLPYGPEDLRGEARFQAGKLLLAESKAITSDPKAAADERRAAYAKELLANAKLLLKASADSSVNHAAKTQARQLLDSIR